MLGIDRKQMEAERLARLAKKRGADTDPDPVSAHPRKIQRTSPTPTKASTREISPPPPSKAKPASSAVGTPKTSASSIIYPHGTIKRTWCFKQQRDGTDIKLEEVLEKSTLSIAVISSWQLDTEYLFSKLFYPRPDLKLLLIMHEEDIAIQEAWRRDAAAQSPNTRLCFPKLPKTGSSTIMHSKLMLLFHPEKLRIVMPSANMRREDWGETGVMENVVFLMDLPRLPPDQQGQKNTTITPFTHDLLDYLDAQNVTQDVRDGVLKFDFGNTAHIAFVGTIPGTHDEEDATKTGLPQLASAVQSLGCAPDPSERIEVDYTASSIGQVNSRIFADLYNAFRGVALTTATPAKEPDGDLRIHYPSLETVRNSLDGFNAAGTLFWSSQDLGAPARPHFSRFCDAKSTRKGVLSHAKMAIVRSRKHAYVYVGSANVSFSAWGRMTQAEKKGSEAKLSANNWECGVVMRAEIDGEVEEGEVVPLDKLKGTVPLLFEIPGEKYLDEEGRYRTPWTAKKLPNK